VSLPLARHHSRGMDGSEAADITAIRRSSECGIASRAGVDVASRPRVQEPVISACLNSNLKAASGALVCAFDRLMANSPVSNVVTGTCQYDRSPRSDTFKFFLFVSIQECGIANASLRSMCESNVLENESSFVERVLKAVAGVPEK
jgi:hypothetical protein